MFPDRRWKSSHCASRTRVVWIMHGRSVCWRNRQLAPAHGGVAHVYRGACVRAGRKPAILAKSINSSADGGTRTLHYRLAPRRAGQGPSGITRLKPHGRTRRPQAFFLLNDRSRDGVCLTAEMPQDESAKVPSCQRAPEPRLDDSRHLRNPQFRLPVGWLIQH